MPADRNAPPPDGVGSARAARAADIRRALDLDLLPEQTSDDRPDRTAAAEPADAAERAAIRRLLDDRPPHHLDRGDDPR